MPNILWDDLTGKAYLPVYDFPPEVKAYTFVPGAQVWLEAHPRAQHLWSNSMTEYQAKEYLEAARRTAPERDLVVAHRDTPSGVQLALGNSRFYIHDTSPGGPPWYRARPALSRFEREDVI